MRCSTVITVDLKLDDYLYERLTAFVITNKTKKSKVIRAAIEELLQKEKIIEEIVGIAGKPGIRIIYELGRPRIHVAFKVDKETLTELDRIAIKYRLSRASLIRIALLQYLKEHEQPVQHAKIEKISLFE